MPLLKTDIRVTHVCLPEFQTKAKSADAAVRRYLERVLPDTFEMSSSVSNLFAVFKDSKPISGFPLDIAYRVYIVSRYK